MNTANMHDSILESNKPSHTYIYTVQKYLTAQQYSLNNKIKNSLWSQFPGTNPAPMPCILCGPGFPPLSTGDSAGSTATVRRVGFTLFRYYSTHTYSTYMS